jgi:ferric-dicitrate binding protein FerR (iron transport regulator)
MQENIYDILTRHFFNQTTAEEEQVIEKYKASNRQEYDKLKRFFEYKNLSTKDFNSQKAWQNVIRKHNKSTASQSKIRPLYPQLRRLVAAAMVVIGLLVGAFYYIGNTFRQEDTLLQAKGDKQQRIELTDGSVVWLNDDATLAYPSTFTGSDRKVTLTGAAFFEIVKDPSKPFIVSTKNAHIRVLGTSFNVDTDTEKTEVSVTTGTVSVQSATSEKSVTVTAGYGATANKDEVTAYKHSNPNYTSWKTGVFTFKQTPLKTVINDLNTFYDNQIQLSPDVDTDCGLTSTFNNVPLPDIIEVLKLTCNLSIQKTKDGYLITQSSQAEN